MNDELKIECQEKERHYPHNIGYIQFFEYCKEKDKKGIKQEQCNFCKCYIWPEFIGKNWGIK